MTEKQLTITIPAYNAENYIERCLDSFLQADAMAAAGQTTENLKTADAENRKRRESKTPDNRLEILVINDGSTDRTEELARQYEMRYPDVIKVITKENGGHGSGINTGLKHATGRYFKVVDADDWVVTENIDSILDALELIDSDVVVTGYKSVNEQTGAEQVYSTSCDYVNCEIGLKEFTSFFDAMPAAFQFHGLCFRTSFFKTLGISMSEGVFYEDQEYAILPFLKADSILLLQYTFYVYRLGGSGQSVSFGQIEKRLGNMEFVLKKLITETQQAKAMPDWRPDRNEFFEKRLAIAVTSFYAAALVKAEDKKRGRQTAETFRAYLKKEDPALCDRVEGKYKTLCKAAKIPGLAGVYGKFSDSGVYQKFKKGWNR